MTQDFAKIRPEPLLEHKPVESPPAWSLMITGVVVGITIGVLACVLFYLSGNVPPLSGETALPVSQVAAIESQPIPADEEPEQELELEFYSALRDYVVPVDAVPVPLGDEAEATGEDQAQASSQNIAVNDLPDEDLGSGFMLQTGAFQQQELAQSEMQRQRTIGLDVVVRQQDLLGRTLYLVQSGPYTSSRRLTEAENLLRRSNIASLRMSLQ